VDEMPVLIVSDPETGTSQKVELEDERMSPLIGRRIGEVRGRGSSSEGTPYPPTPRSSTSRSSRSRRDGGGRKKSPSRRRLQKKKRMPLKKRRLKRSNGFFPKFSNRSVIVNICHAGGA